jgi:glucan phosphoethanolaminetransferase (alkaline phosphatase superfamily)
MGGLGLGCAGGSGLGLGERGKGLLGACGPVISKPQVTDSKSKMTTCEMAVLVVIGRCAHALCCTTQRMSRDAFLVVWLIAAAAAIEPSCLGVLCQVKHMLYNVTSLQAAASAERCYFQHIASYCYCCCCCCCWNLRYVGRARMY